MSRGCILFVIRPSFFHLAPQFGELEMHRSLIYKLLLLSSRSGLEYQYNQAMRDDALLYPLAPNISHYSQNVQFPSQTCTEHC